MELQEIKKKLLTKCTKQQAEVIRQLQQEISDAQKQANDYGQPKDRYDAFRTKLMRQIELYAGQLDKANVVLAALQKIPTEHEFKEVEFGALIITNKQKIFVSAGLGKVEFEGETYFVVSPHVPIFVALKGKRKGEEIVFNGMTLIIEEIC